MGSTLPGRSIAVFFVTPKRCKYSLNFEGPNFCPMSIKAGLHELTKAPVKSKEPWPEVF